MAKYILLAGCILYLIVSCVGAIDPAMWKPQHGSEDTPEFGVETDECSALLNEARAALPNYSLAIQKANQGVECAEQQEDNDDRKALLHKLHFLLGECAHHIHDCAKAENNFLTAMEYDSNSTTTVTIQLCEATISCGWYDEATKYCNKAIELAPEDPKPLGFNGNFHMVMGEPKTAKHFYLKALKIDPNHDYSLENMAELFMKTGLSKDAIKYAQKCVDVTEDAFTEARCYRYLGSANFQLGRVSVATKMYEKAFQIYPEVKLGFEWYYQYYAHVLHTLLDRPYSEFNMDRAMNKPVLDAWGMVRTFHTPMNDPGYVPPPDIDTKKIPDVQDGELFKLTPDGQIAGNAGRLLRAADKFMGMYQLNALGFNQNIRQLRAMSLATIDVAQQVTSYWKTLSRAKKMRVNDAAASGSCTGGFLKTNVNTDISVGPGCDGSGTHEFGWRDAWDLAVKWRQISGVIDTVFWGDVVFWVRPDKNLDTDAFSATYMVDGQTKNIRYYNYLKPLFEKMKNNFAWQIRNKKEIPKAQGEKMIRDAFAAKTLDEFMIVTGDPKYFGFNTFVQSPTRDTSTMGTHISSELSVIGGGGYKFSIRTSRFRIRNDIFNMEMKTLWKQLNFQAQRKTRNIHEMSRIIVRMAHTWFNMMPLNRGTAGVGMSVIQGLLLAIGIETTKPMPWNKQLDFESMVHDSPDTYQRMIEEFLNLRRKNTQMKPLKLPNVSRTFPTPRHIFAVLNAAADHMDNPFSSTWAMGESSKTWPRKSELVLDSKEDGL